MKKQKIISIFVLILCLSVFLSSCDPLLGGVRPEDRSSSSPENSTESSNGSNEESKNDSSELENDDKSEATSENASDETPNEVQKEEFGEVSQGTSLADLYEYCIDSCVSIICKGDVRVDGIFGSTSYETTSLGSGFVINGGYIVTNEHVVDNAKSVKVLFSDGEEIEAEIIGSDKTCDIAVLKIKTNKTLYPVKIGDSSSLKIGEEVIAIGTPSAIELAGTLTYGVVSGLNRKMEVTDDVTGKLLRTMYLIQTDATLNPGNSGGPLFNMKGEVVGINNMKLMDTFEGIGFSIPINGAMDIINALINGTEVPDSDYAVTSAYLGITGATVSKVRKQYNLADSVPDGVLVLTVERNSAAYKAGLDAYDVITEFDGVKVKTLEELKAELAKHNSGKEITMVVYRPSRNGSTGETITLKFKLDRA